MKFRLKRREVSVADEKDFKVVDRRHSSPDEAHKPAAEKRPIRGEGFTSEEAPVTAADEVDFSTFVLSLATGALISMGVAPDPTTKQVTKNLIVAKQNIDILGMIREKTRGNLSDEEEKLIENLLTEIRLRFVQASRS